jgi:hypothetical protein
MKYFAILFVFALAVLLACNESRAQCANGQCTAAPKQQAVKAACTCSPCHCHTQHQATARTGPSIGNVRSRIQARRDTGRAFRPIRRVGSLFRVLRCR